MLQTVPDTLLGRDDSVFCAIRFGIIVLSDVFWHDGGISGLEILFFRNRRAVRSCFAASLPSAFAGDPVFATLFYRFPTDSCKKVSRKGKKATKSNNLQVSMFDIYRKSLTFAADLRG